MHGPARASAVAGASATGNAAPPDSPRPSSRASALPIEKNAIDRGRSPRALEHAAGDRLREALAAAQDDPRSASKIARLIAQAAAEERRNRALAERVWYWRDPFSANPREPIVLSLEVQLEMQLAATRQEAARARVESAIARLEAANAHAEAARARVEASRAQEAAERGHPLIARRDGRPARRGEGGAGLVARSGPTIQARDPESPPDDSAARRRAALHLQRAALARNERAAAPEPGGRHRDIGPARAISAAPDGREAPSTDPASWPSSDPRGIVVVPINPPVATLPRR
jgi:hypothetical protein